MPRRRPHSLSPVPEGSVTRAIDVPPISSGVDPVSLSPSGAFALALARAKEKK
jgi:hypothetical protein